MTSSYYHREYRHHRRLESAYLREKKYLEELISGVNRAVEVIGQLDKVVNKIRKDCE